MKCSIPHVPIGRLTALLVAAIVFFPAHPSATAGDLTALQLIKEGNRYIGEQAKDKVVQIRSEKSVAGLAPTLWYVVYYDPTATFKAVEVKFGAGQMMEVKRPLRALEPVTGSQRPLEASKLKTDSDKVLKIAAQDPLLSRLTLTASQMKLEHGETGPVWKVRLWAEKIRDSRKTVDIGEIFIAAEDGSVIKRDFHINRVE